MEMKSEYLWAQEPINFAPKMRLKPLLGRTPSTNGLAISRLMTERGRQRERRDRERETERERERQREDGSAEGARHEKGFDNSQL
jgi:hypothetical protein